MTNTIKNLTKAHDEYKNRRDKIAYMYTAFNNAIQSYRQKVTMREKNKNYYGENPQN